MFSKNQISQEQKTIKGYWKKHWNHKCLAIVMMYVSNKCLKKG